MGRTIVTIRLIPGPLEVRFSLISCNLLKIKALKKFFSVCIFSLTLV